MSNVRLKRLQADHQKLTDYVRRHPRLRLIQAAGEPPEQYQIEYRITSLRQVGDVLEEAKTHLVEISLPRNYPRTPPQCRMLTPVFHPNIAPHAICVGDHWSAGEPLMSIVARIGEMLAFQSYNVKSPLNGDAARWVELHLDQLPLDQVSLLIEESAPLEQQTPPVVSDLAVTDSTPSALPPATPPTEVTSFVDSSSSSQPSDALEVIYEDEPPKPAVIVVACPSCATEFRIAAANVGKKARCSWCQTVFQIKENGEPHA